MRLERIVPGGRRTAAAVSSQEDSMAKIGESGDTEEWLNQDATAKQVNQNIKKCLEDALDPFPVSLFSRFMIVDWLSELARDGCSMR
jgi:hypothetical protein